METNVENDPKILNMKTIIDLQLGIIIITNLLVSSKHKEHSFLNYYLENLEFYF